MTLVGGKIKGFDDSSKHIVVGHQEDGMRDFRFTPSRSHCLPCGHGRSRRIDCQSLRKKKQSLVLFWKARFLDGALQLFDDFVTEAFLVEHVHDTAKSVEAVSSSGDNARQHVPCHAREHRVLNGAPNLQEGLDQ